MCRACAARIAIGHLDLPPCAPMREVTNIPNMIGIHKHQQVNIVSLEIGEDPISIHVVLGPVLVLAVILVPVARGRRVEGSHFWGQKRQKGATRQAGATRAQSLGRVGSQGGPDLEPQNGRL